MEYGAGRLRGWIVYNCKWGNPGNSSKTLLHAGRPRIIAGQGKSTVEIHRATIIFPVYVLIHSPGAAWPSEGMKLTAGFTLHDILLLPPSSLGSSPTTRPTRQASVHSFIHPSVYLPSLSGPVPFLLPPRLSHQAVPLLCCPPLLAQIVMFCWGHSCHSLHSFVLPCILAS